MPKKQKKPIAAPPVDTDGEKPKNPNLATKANGRWKAGRPKMKLDEQQIFQLAAFQCTLDEIAAVMKCCVETLVNNYKDLIHKGKEAGKTSLRRAQFRAAMNGNAAMLIWLGKQYLDQKDQREAISTFEPEVRQLLNKWKEKQDQLDIKEAEVEVKS